MKNPKQKSEQIMGRNQAPYRNHHVSYKEVIMLDHLGVVLGLSWDDLGVVLGRSEQVRETGQVRE